MKYALLFLALCFLGCSNDLAVENTLAASISDKEFVLDNVIACAASNQNDDLVSVFLYPREGASNLQYYEANTGEIDKNDFTQYNQVEAPLLDVFNGFLKKFEVAIPEEKWVIVTFEEAGKVHVSNPIRIKNQSKPTEFISSNVSVRTNTINPIFNWEDGIYDDTKIYFQVLTDVSNDFISGTYTFEKTFQFYELDNVVLNITPGTPETLQSNETYGFTLLAVSEDNWVNLFSELDFSLD
ncbi:hypothetical protein [Maribacter sp. 2210JD10-5]|uniref:hypothetical protein n=1 Tax=Maribacter sp. 2210JD10-5 TaxID=3386272 RepID=UPI0039BC28F6